jgi:hypothetical protein
MELKCLATFPDTRLALTEQFRSLERRRLLLFPRVGRDL